MDARVSPSSLVLNYRAMHSQASEALLTIVQADVSMLTPSKQKQRSLILDLLFRAIPLMEHIPPAFSLKEANLLRQVLPFIDTGYFRRLHALYPCGCHVSSFVEAKSCLAIA